MSTIEHLERRQTRRLAQALQVAFRIPAGRDLVGVLGRGEERDNLEALIVWVEQRLADPDPRLAEAALPYLTDELERTLMRFEAESRWTA